MSKPGLLSFGTGFLVSCFFLFIASVFYGPKQIFIPFEPLTVTIPIFPSPESVKEEKKESLEISSHTITAEKNIDEDALETERLKDKVERLYQKTDYGLTPAPLKDENDETVFDAFRHNSQIRDFDPNGFHILIPDYGVSSKTSELILKSLPNTVSLILSPYSLDAEKWAKAARKKGFEILVHIPIKHENNLNAGQLALTNNIADLSKNEDKIRALLSLSPQIIGGVTDTSKSKILSENLSIFERRGFPVFSLQNTAQTIVLYNYDGLDTLNALRPKSVSVIAPTPASLGAISAFAEQSPQKIIPYSYAIAP